MKSSSAGLPLFLRNWVSNEIRVASLLFLTLFPINEMPVDNFYCLDQDHTQQTVRTDVDPKMFDTLNWFS